MQFLDIHTHQQRKDAAIRSMLSISLTGEAKIMLPADQEISVGLHPWFATLAQLETDYGRLVETLNNRDIKLIGECGLDKLRGDQLGNQIVVLRKQLVLANDICKPVILHCVRCFDELMGLQKEMKLNIPLIVHGFNKNEELGSQLMNKGFYLSFGPAILNAGSGAAAMLKHADVFFLETDDGGFSIEEIYQAAANLKNCTVEALKAHIFANWKKIKLI